MNNTFKDLLFSRSWFQGMPADELLGHIEPYIEQIRSQPKTSSHGVLIAEAEPLQYAYALFASILLESPTILGYHDWSRLEWQTLHLYCSPGLIFGSAPPADTASKTDQRPALDASAIYIPTGGTTSGLRFAKHSLGSLSAHCKGLHQWLGDKPIHSINNLPLHHVSGLMPIFRALESGGTHRIIAKTALFENLIPSPGTGRWNLSLVFAQLSSLLDHPIAIENMRGMENVFLGGGPPDHDLICRALKAKIPIRLTYGMTETASMVAIHQPTIGNEIPSAQPLPHAEVRIRPSDQRIEIRTNSLFRGYLPGSAEPPCDTDGWFTTGDLGEWTRHHKSNTPTIKILGRADRLIISGGEKIDPAEIEKTIQAHPLVLQSCVAGLPDPKWGTQIVAVIVAKPDTFLGEDEIRDYMRAQLSPYKIPKQIKILPEMPLTSAGKLDLRAIFN